MKIGEISSTRTALSVDTKCQGLDNSFHVYVHVLDPVAGRDLVSRSRDRTMASQTTSKEIVEKH